GEAHPAPDRWSARLSGERPFWDRYMALKPALSTQLTAAFCSALSAGALDRMVARCAAKIEASAWTPSDVSPPLRISADRAPMQPSAERIGATTAPLEPLGREGTICSTPERYAAAAALLAERGTGGTRAIISGL